MKMAEATAAAMNAVERAVVAKGRPSPSSSSSSSSPSLVLIHPPPAAASVPAVAFARHATLLHRHLLGRLRASSRYAGVVLVGLEDDPARMLPPPSSEGEEESLGDLVLLDGFRTTPWGGNKQAAAATGLDFASAQAFAASVWREVASVTALEAEPEAEEKEERELCCRALGIDSVNMLAHRLGSADGALRAIQALLAVPPSSSFSSPEVQQQRQSLLTPVVTVLYPEGVMEAGGGSGCLTKSVWEDVATTNIYVHPGEGGRGRCLVVRRSASGRVQEEWEAYRIEPGPGADPSRCRSGAAATMRVVLGVGGGRPAAGAAAGGSDAGEAPAPLRRHGAAAAPWSKRKEEAFLESLPFRLSLNDQEQAMRQGVVLPHERRRTTTGEALPLTYQQEEEDVPGIGAGGYEDEEEELELDDDEEDEGLDDDLDL